MIYRVKKDPTSLIVQPVTTSRAPGNVPYLIDNLWEWLRPADYASRRTAAFASPTTELAAAGASGSVQDAWGLELLDGQPAFQINGGKNPADARHHEDIRRLQRLVWVTVCARHSGDVQPISAGLKPPFSCPV